MPESPPVLMTATSPMRSTPIEVMCVNRDTDTSFSSTENI